MAKILDKDFRNELYKGLCDAGYSKDEAKFIVSVKYRDTLKANIVEKLKVQADAIENGKSDVVLTVEEYSSALAELAKLEDFFKKNEKSS